MTIPNVFDSTSRVATWDGAGIYDALAAEIAANGAGNGITIASSTTGGMLLAFAQIDTDFGGSVLFSVREGATANDIAVGIAADGVIDGAGDAATAPTGTGSDWSGEKSYDWTSGAPGAGSKMWTILFDDALFVLVTDTANTFHPSALHLGRIIIPTTGADDFANGRDGLGFLMGVPDSMDNGSGNDWLQAGAGAPSLVHMETGIWSEAGVPNNSQNSSATALTPGEGPTYTPPPPMRIGGYYPISQKAIGITKYICAAFASAVPLTVRPNPVTNQGWLHINNAAGSEDVIIPWDKTVTP